MEIRGFDNPFASLPLEFNKIKNILHMTMDNKDT